MDQKIDFLLSKYLDNNTVKLLDRFLNRHLYIKNNIIRMPQFLPSPDNDRKNKYILHLKIKNANRNFEN